MTGNATFRHRDVALLAVVGIEAPVVVPSTVFDERLAPTLKRLRLPQGLLSRVAGVHERRWWDEEMTFDDAATAAGAKALAEAGIDAGDVGLLINTSVTRTFLEPSVASRIHSGLSPAVERARLRPDQRVPRLRQRHDARGAADRLGADPVRGHRQRRGPAPDAGGHARRG